jgi:hypothetical protein
MSVIASAQLHFEVPRMRKPIVVAGCLFLFCAGWAFGQQTAMTWNGTSWKTLNRFERALYVAGFNKGHVAGMREALEEALEMVTAVRPASSWTPEEKKELMKKAEQHDQKSAANSDLTIGQLEATISTFYDDYRNMPVCWDDATKFSTLSLKGNAPTEKELNAARNAGAESGCK